MHSVAEKSPKEWWSLLKEIKMGAEWTGPESHVPIQALTLVTACFKNLYTDDQPTERPEESQTIDPNMNFFRNNPSNTSNNSFTLAMDMPITMNEIFKVI